MSYVWVLAGGSVPYVLRKMPNNHYRFVGEAYVGALMQGEGFVGVQDDELGVVVLE